jgi:hypothetical protein
MGQLPPRGPRRDAFWRRQAGLMHEAVRLAWQDEEIGARWRGVLDSLAACHTIGATSPHADAMADVAGRLLDDLMTALRRRHPKIEHVFGPGLVLFLLVAAEAMRTGAMPAWAPRVIWRFLPDNPLESLPNGILLHADEAGPEHFHQLAEYKQSLRPRGQAGRSRGSGHFRTGEEFRRAMSTLIRHWHATTGTRPTRENLAEMSGCTSGVPDIDARMIRRYCREFGVDLDALIEAIVTP